MLFVAKKMKFINNQETNKLGLSQFVSIAFEMISLKLMKSLTNFCWLEINLSELHLKKPGFTYSA